MTTRRRTLRELKTEIRSRGDAPAYLGELTRRDVEAWLRAYHPDWLPGILYEALEQDPLVYGSTLYRLRPDAAVQADEHCAKYLAAGVCAPVERVGEGDSFAWLDQIFGPSEWGWFQAVDVTPAAVLRCASCDAVQSPGARWHVDQVAGHRERSKVLIACESCGAGVEVLREPGPDGFTYAVTGDAS